MPSARNLPAPELAWSGPVAQLLSPTPEPLVTPQSREASIAVQVAQRLLELKRSGEGDADFARRLGLSPQQISNYRAGSGASVDAITAVVSRTDVNPRWLLTGDGPVHVPTGESPQRDYRAGAESVVDEVRRLLDGIQQRLEG